MLSHMLVRAVPALLGSSVVASLFRPELMIGDAITELWLRESQNNKV